jgi:hemoglobin
MIAHIMAVALLVVATSDDQAVPPGEKPVKPYVISNENADAEPFKNDKLFKKFNGVDGLTRISDDLVERLTTDPRVEGIFRASDLVRLRRTLVEQFCYILGGPCDYTGRSMEASHRDHGITKREFNILVELMQKSMDKEGIAFSDQNKLLAKLAPMYRVVVKR